ncbi:MAG: hypothetical protein H7Z37_07230 [Pyrinomonadaceae bacterium]|nr:hypothetical protein [Pyrinomonadaceae bacterium]
MLANRAYSKNFGAEEDYRDGYQQGYEGGYGTGYDRQQFNSSIPDNLDRRGVRNVNISGSSNGYDDTSSTRPNQNGDGGSNSNNDNGYDNGSSQNNSSQPTIIIPAQTEIIIELGNKLGTEENRQGDAFKAKVVSPIELEGATVEGRVTAVRQAGRIKRRSELTLSFDRIVLSDSRWSNLSGTLVEVVPLAKKNTVSGVDNEGIAKGRSSLPSDAAKVGAATGTGLVIGAVAGGPAGAAVGAGVGAAFGLGAVLVMRGKEIKLEQGQQLRLKTSYETQIR